MGSCLAACREGLVHTQNVGRGDHGADGLKRRSLERVGVREERPELRGLCLLHVTRAGGRETAWPRGCPDAAPRPGPR